MSFPRYPDYRDSGVEWLGEVPAHWSVDRFKRSTLLCVNGIWGGEPLQNEDDIPCVRVADFDRQRLRVTLTEPTIRNVTARERQGRELVRGNLLLEKSGGGDTQPVGAVVLYDDDRPAVCSNFVARMQLADGMVPSFWRYQHAAAYAARLNLRSIKQTSGIQNLDQQQYLDERAAFPPTTEQARIATFLDHETATIDSLIAEQNRLIELLQEKRQTVISHAVTKGLNPNARVRPSGLDWLGDVPAHWISTTIRRVLRQITQGWSPECLGRPAEDQEWGVLKSGCVNRGVFDEQENKALPSSLGPVPELEVRAGDVLMSRASGSLDLLGSAAYVQSPRPRLMLSDKTYRLEPVDTMSSRYLALLLNSRLLRAQIERAVSGAGGLANNLPQSALLSFVCAVPPVSEQEEIVTHIDMESDRLGTLVDAAKFAINVLRERRTALISATVTGQIDVRGLAKGQPA